MGELISLEQLVKPISAQLSRPNVGLHTTFNGDWEFEPVPFVTGRRRAPFRLSGKFENKMKTKRIASDRGHSCVISN